jgi:hypothetical protein
MGLGLEFWVFVHILDDFFTDVFGLAMHSGIFIVFSEVFYYRFRDLL